MMLKQMPVNEFVELTASDAPVPGGGSVSALCAALSSALTQMVAGLTAGKKAYMEVDSEMRQIVEKMPALRQEFLDIIDKDSAAFDKVMEAFRLPKGTDEEKEIRRNEINKATLYAAQVPMDLARKAMSLIETCRFVATRGNKNAMSDIAVGTMMLRTAVRGALFNVRINLAGLPDGEEKETLSAETEKMECEIEKAEKEILNSIKV